MAAKQLNDILRLQDSLSSLEQGVRVLVDTKWFSCTVPQWLGYACCRPSPRVGVNAKYHSRATYFAVCV